MANGKFGSLWKMLKEYNFEIDLESNSDAICCICNNLLKNAQQGVCGCLYCQECFKLFLSTDEKHCPGKNGKCKEYMINIALNLQVDHLANKRVAGVVVKCPIDFCQFKDRLSDMEHHMETHVKGNRCRECLREFDVMKKEMLSLKEEIHKAQSRNKVQVSGLQEELENLKTVTELCKEEVRRMKRSYGNEKNRAKDTEIDEELNLLDYVDDDFGMESDDWRKRKPPPTLSPIFDAVKETAELVPVLQVTGVNYMSLIVTEVHRQTGDLRSALEKQEAELTRLKNELQKRSRNHGDNTMEPIDLTEPEPGVPMAKQGFTESLVTVQVSQDDRAATQDGKSTRRRLKRDLPPANHVLDKSVAMDKCSPANADQSSETALVLQTTPDSTAPPLRHPVPLVTPKSSDSQSKIGPGVLLVSKESLKPVEPKVRPEVSENLRKKAKHVAFSAPKAKVVIVPVPACKGVIHPLVLQRNSERSFIKPTRARGGRLQTIAAIPQTRTRCLLHVKDEHPKVPEAPFSLRSYTPYELKIDNFAHKIFQSKQGPYSIYSPPFYSSKTGYKLCLRVDPNRDRFGSSAYLGLFFCVLQGEFDTQLPWPMRMEVTLSLIDQVSRIPYTSRTFDFESAPDNWKHVFSKPSMGNSGVVWFGAPQFIHFDFLCSNSSLVFQDSLVIRCSTSSADLF